MRFARLSLLTLALALTGAEAAQAQNFFERLFGIAPARPIPQQPAPQVVPAPGPDGQPPGEDGQRRHSAPPIQARPVSMRTPTEDALIGRELKQNGSTGSLKIERAGSEFRARLTLAGRRSNQNIEACSVTLNGGQPAPMASQGRPEGLQRYTIADPSCPLTIDILDEAVLIKGPSESCTFQAANCQVEAGGMWGPEPNQLVGKARDYESSRGTADRSVRENYKALVQRSRPEGVRPIVAEQAGFSSEREMLCRTYAREAAHSFCNARFTEGRVVTLANRLGITVASNTTPPPPPGERPRRRNEQMGLPAPEDLVQGRSFPIE